MKLSIITVNLNNAAGLEKTAESVTSQTFTDFEWIVIDGGSTDGSVDVIRKYEDRITCWVSERDSGIYNAMNKGVKMAKGEYLQFLNSGDWLADKSVVSDVMNERFSAPIVYGNVYHMDGTKVVRARRYGDAAFAILMTSSISHQSSYISRELLLQNPYNETNKIASDWEFWLKMIFSGVDFQYMDRFISCFDLNGISENNHLLSVQERNRIYESCVPNCISGDYLDKKMGRLIWLSGKYPFIQRLLSNMGFLMKKWDSLMERVNHKVLFGM